MEDGKYKKSTSTYQSVIFENFHPNFERETSLTHFEENLYHNDVRFVSIRMLLKYANS